MVRVLLGWFVQLIEYALAKPVQLQAGRPQVRRVPVKWFCSLSTHRRSYLAHAPTQQQHPHRGFCALPTRSPPLLPVTLSLLRHRRISHFAALASVAGMRLARRGSASARSAAAASELQAARRWGQYSKHRRGGVVCERCAEFHQGHNWSISDSSSNLAFDVTGVCNIGSGAPIGSLQRHRSGSAVHRLDR